MTRPRNSRSGSTRDYARTDRVRRLLREIVAEALERIDDERLVNVAITDVQVDPEVRRAVVYFDSLAGPEEDRAVIEAFLQLRVRLQAEIARQARLRNTPELVFRPDEAIRTGERIDQLLRDLHRDDAGDTRDTENTVGEAETGDK